MKIAVASSMMFAEKMANVKKELEKMGHTVVISRFLDEYIGKNDNEKKRLTAFHKNSKDAIRSFWSDFQDCDALLVLNYDKGGVKNYIGGNTFLEMGFAYVLGKKIYLLNPIPDIEYYRGEIEAMKPIVINGDLGKISS